MWIEDLQNINYPFTKLQPYRNDLQIYIRILQKWQLHNLRQILVYIGIYNTLQISMLGNSSRHLFKYEFFWCFWLLEDIISVLLNLSECIQLVKNVKSFGVSLENGDDSIIPYTRQRRISISHIGGDESHQGS